MRRRVPAVAVLAVVLAVLTACAGLPSAGPVQQGLPADHVGESSDISFIPERPQPGATPQEIVDGFLRAGSGTADNWQRAREFLTESADWQPNTGVTVDLLGSREVVAVDDDSVSVRLVAVATVDDKGTYEPADLAETTLTFDLAQQSDGEWRITEAPDGVVIDRTLFGNVYDSYPLMYFTQSWDYLVPDVRWFPRTNAATRIADALVNKPPTEWLAGSVFSAFPEGVSASPAVPVSAGKIASVTLNGPVFSADQEALDRMYTQLLESLKPAQVTGVEMLVDSGIVPAESTPTLRTSVTGPPLVLTEETFGFLAGDDLTPIPGLSPAVREASPVAVQVGRDRAVAAVRQSDGTVVRVIDDPDVAPAVVDTRPGLVDPTIDTYGAVWSAPTGAPQDVVALLADDGGFVEVADAWPGANQLVGMSVSRDGARIAALVVSGGRLAVWVAGVLRDVDGVPLSLGAPVSLGTLSGTGVGVAWLDDVTVGVVTRDADEGATIEQLVGGPAVVTSAPADVASIAGGNSLASVRLRGADGTIYIKRGANWQQTADGVLVLATQQGMPQ